MTAASGDYTTPNLKTQHPKCTSRNEIDIDATRHVLQLTTALSPCATHTHNRIHIPIHTNMRIQTYQITHIYASTYIYVYYIYIYIVHIDIHNSSITATHIWIRQS